MLRLGLLVAVFATLQVAVFADVQLVVINGHNMVKLSAFSHQFGAVTSFDGRTNTYCVSRHGRLVYLTPYSLTAWVGDNPVTFEAVPVVVDGVVYVPMGFLCHNLGLSCTWGPAYSQVVIINIFTHRHVTWGRDSRWAARPHHWLHPVTYRSPQRFHASPRLTFKAGHISPGFYSKPGSHRAPTGVFKQHVPTRVPALGHGTPPPHSRMEGSPGSHNRTSARQAPHQGERRSQDDNRR